MKKIKKELIFNRFKEWKFPVIDENGNTSFGWKVFNRSKLYLGENIDIGYGTILNAAYGIVIGSYTQIGPYVTILSKSTIPCKKMNGEVIIKPQVMIGCYSTIMPGVTLGEGCIVPAYSYIDKDVPPMTIFDKNKSSYEFEEIIYT